MGKATLSVLVDEALKTAFCRAVAARRETEAQVISGLMRDYVEQQEAGAYHSRVRQKAESAKTSTDRGDLVSDEDVEAEFARLRGAL